MTRSHLISVTSSGIRHDSSMPTPSRTCGTPAANRPAWRMNQPGRCRGDSGGGCPQILHGQPRGSDRDGDHSYQGQDDADGLDAAQPPPRSSLAQKTVATGYSEPSTLAAPTQAPPVVPPVDAPPLITVT
jgi:hypothetical protein